MVGKKKDRYNPTTAADTLKPHKDKRSPQDVEQAEQDGVVAAAYSDYSDAMDNYQGRSDVETLANRRAREGASNFSDNDHHRALADKADGGVVTTDEAKSSKNTKPEKSGTETVTAVPVNQVKADK